MPPPITVCYSLALADSTPPDARRLVASLRGYAADLGLQRIGVLNALDCLQGENHRVWFDADLSDGATMTVGLAGVPAGTAQEADEPHGDRLDWSWSGVVRTGNVKVLSKLLALAAKFGGVASLSFAGLVVTYREDEGGTVLNRTRWVIGPDDHDL